MSIEKSADELDLASQLQDQANEQALARTRAMNKPQTDPRFDGEHCVEEDCGVLLPHCACKWDAYAASTVNQLKNGKYERLHTDQRDNQPAWPRFHPACIGRKSAYARVASRPTAPRLL